MEKENLKRKFTNEKTGISYTLVGDYYVPNLVMKQEKKVSLNKYGRARLKFLKDHQKVEYTILFTKGELYKHLDEIQTIAQERVNLIIEQLKKQSNLAEDMKNTNPLYWTDMMNNFKNQAEEIIMKELTYR